VGATGIEEEEEEEEEEDTFLRKRYSAWYKIEAGLSLFIQ
jgi:hypothetical protein